MKVYATALTALTVISFLHALGVRAAEPPAQPAATNLLTNPGFEASGDSTAQPAGWEAFWTRKPNAGTATVVSQTFHGGSHALEVRHTGDADWSAGQTAQIPVTSGDILTLSAWIKSEGLTPDANDAGEAGISVVARRSDGTTIDWQLGFAPAGGHHDWKQYTHRLVVPADCATVQFRFTGTGPIHAWLDDASLTREGNVKSMMARSAGKSLRLTNRFLDARISGDTGALTVTDTRIGRTWTQQVDVPDIVVTGMEPISPQEARLTLFSVSDAVTFQATMTLAAEVPEVTVSLNAPASAPLKTKLGYPLPFVTGEDTSLIVPLNEGIQYPVNDASVRPPGPLVTYGGHGICMPWWGVTTQTGEGPGVQAILSTPDDADIEIQRTTASGERLFIRPFWEAQKGTFGYARKVTYVFTDRGGYVAQAKRYRRWSQQSGLFKSLADKRRENPNVDKLIGAANIWNWDSDRVALCKEMKSLGMDRILWSSGGTPDELKAINAMGYLTSRYDIYQDVWSSDAPKGLKTEGWPDDLVLLPDGSWMKGWAHIVRHPDGTQTVYPGGVISSSRGLARAKREIPEDLATHPDLCRFIDTTTAAPFREDYSPVHPLTRSQDRHYKMALLEFCSKDEKLVTGSETGLDAAVPYVDYFEGMLSLGPYRLPDAGRDMLQYKPPTADFLKYQIGPVYRIPLWELVYHDCVVADWYWGDYNNKAPEVWDQRDLFNVLYGTPPLLMFTKATWEKDKPRFIQSYQTICPVVRRLGYDEMLSHAFLTPDHTVQRTHWRSGATITVNFGKTPYTDGKETIAPMGWKITPKGK